MRDNSPEVIVTVLLIISFVAGSAMWDAWSCGAKADAMKLKHQWGFATGCMVEHDGAMVPLKNLRVEQ